MKIWPIILAGGHGTRLDGDTPKPLREFIGKPLITQVLSQIDFVDGLEYPSIIVDDKSLEDYWATWELLCQTWDCYAMVDDERTGTANATRLAIEALDKEEGASPDDLVLVMPCDHYYVPGTNLKECLGWAKEMVQTDGTMGVLVASKERYVNEDYDLVHLRIDSCENQVATLGKSAYQNPGQQIRFWNAGIYLTYAGYLFNYLENATKGSSLDRVIGQAILKARDSRRWRAVFLEMWMDVGTTAMFDTANMLGSELEAAHQLNKDWESLWRHKDERKQ